MSYKNKFGSTNIRSTDIDNLGISWDYDTDPNRNRYPVLLFTPDMNNKINHYHIRLNKRQAKVMRDWLNAYLNDEKNS